MNRASNLASNLASKGVTKGVRKPARLACALLGLGLGPALGGCVAATSGSGVSVDNPGSAAADAPVGRAEGESADDLDARKDRLYLDYRAKAAQASSDAGACEQLCSLATSICGVQEKLCRIADDHPADDHYQDLCREAKRECQETQQSCIACVESNARHQSTPAQTERGPDPAAPASSASGD